MAKLFLDTNMTIHESCAGGCYVTWDRMMLKHADKVARIQLGELFKLTDTQFEGYVKSISYDYARYSAESIQMCNEEYMLDSALPINAQSKFAAKDYPTLEKLFKKLIELLGIKRVYGVVDLTTYKITRDIIIKKDETVKSVLDDLLYNVAHYFINFNNDIMIVPMRPAPANITPYRFKDDRLLISLTRSITLPTRTNKQQQISNATNSEAQTEQVKTETIAKVQAGGKIGWEIKRTEMPTAKAPITQQQKIKEPPIEYHDTLQGRYTGPADHMIVGDWLSEGFLIFDKTINYANGKTFTDITFKR